MITYFLLPAAFIIMMKFLIMQQLIIAPPLPPSKVELDLLMKFSMKCNLICYLLFLATALGRGVYFARDASYSARDTYTPPDANGHKYMYYARVLTGQYTRGNSSLLVPPPKDPSNPAVLHESVVDNVQNPGIFVVFQDAHVYPEYLITFH